MRRTWWWRCCLPGRPSAQYDRGYKRTLYGRYGVREYWLVDPEAETVEVLTEGDAELTVAETYRSGETLVSALLSGLAVDLESVFSGSG